MHTMKRSLKGGAAPSAGQQQPPAGSKKRARPQPPQSSEPQQQRRRAQQQQQQRQQQPPDRQDGDEDASSGDEEEEASSSGGDDSFPEVSSSDEEEQQAGSDDEGDDDQEDAQEIRVEFEFFSPGEKDFLGLKALLTNYLDGELFDSSGLIDAIIKNEVGLVVKTDEDDDPIAVLAALNTQEHKDTAFLKQIRAFLLAKCPAAHKAALNKAFDAAGTGVLVNDRLLNAPPQLSPPLLQFVMQDIQDCAEDDEVLDAQARSYFDFKRYLLCTRVYVEQQNVAALGGGAAGAASGAGSSKKQAGGSDEAPLVFTRPEDEFLHRHCAWSFTFPVEGRPVTKDGLLAYRLVMQVDADKVPAARAELDRVVGNMAVGGVALAATATAAGEDEEDEEEVADAEEEEEEDQEEAPKAAKQQQANGSKKQQQKKGKKASGGGGAAGGAGGGVSKSEIERLAAEAFAAAAAAGAGKGAAHGGKKKKHKVKAVQL